MKYVSAVTAAVCVTTCSVFAQTVAVEKVPVKISSPVAKAEPGSAKSASDERTLRFITAFDSPPFSFKEGIKNEGFEIELGEAIGKEMGAKVEWIKKNFNISTYVSALDSGSADAAIAAISITENRRKQLAFTRPYFRTSLAAAVQKDIDWRHNKFTTGLKNWLVGVVRGTTGERWARKNLAATVRTYSTPDRLYQALKDMNPQKLAKELKKPDPGTRELLSSAPKMRDLKGETGFCALLDAPILAWIFSKHAYRCKIVEEGIDHEDYGIAVSKRNTELLAELNAALESLDKSGVYDRIYEKWYTKASDLPLLKK